MRAYPVHPELFDRLYNDWANLEKFQKTRGVLRLMSAVIHRLWERNDAGLMILPAAVPVDAPEVQEELIRISLRDGNTLFKQTLMAPVVCRCGWMRKIRSSVVFLLAVALLERFI